MDSTCRTKTVQSICRDIGKGKILLTHKLQRKEGQWNRDAKSYLIDSLLRKYPINPSYSIKEDGTLSIIDGVQRLSTLRDYMNDVFALSKKLEPVIINDEEKEIAGKKYSKLDKEVQDELKSAELQICELTDCTEKDVREIFRRQNAGKALNATQLRTTVITDEFADILYSLTSNAFFEKALSPAQRRKDLDRDMIIETLMLINTNAEHQYTCFQNKDINDFIAEYQQNINEEQLNYLKQAMDKMDESFETFKVKAVSIPMILYAACKVLKNKQSFGRYVEAVQNFIDNYDTNEEYKQYCQSGTSSVENVTGRYEYWNNIAKSV